MKTRKIGILAGALGAGVLVGLVIAYEVGPLQSAQPRDVSPYELPDEERLRSSGADADPTPPVGTKIHPPMPVAKLRDVTHSFTAADPLRVVGASLGKKAAEERELHVTLENRGQCTVTSFAGLAYGFDVSGQPSRMNKGGEFYVAFRAADVTFAPNDTLRYVAKLHHAWDAAVVVAHVDEVTCANGPTWRR